MTQIFALIQTLLGLLLLSLAFLAARGNKELGSITMMLPASRWRRIPIAAFFVASGIACLIGIFIPLTVFFASVFALLSAALTAFLHVRPAPSRTFVIPLLLAIASIATGISQPLGLKVLLLPKAETLPVSVVPSRVVKTYVEGLWFEGIAAGTNGDLYLAGNRGLNFSVTDYYREGQGELIVRKPSGAESVLFRTPIGTTAGVITVGPDGTLYMTSHGEASVIWKIDITGHSTKLAQLPAGAWPNGIDFGPDGMLYSPDSALGLIWRIDAASGAVQQVIKDKLLSARPLIALAPGANGLHFSGRDMYVTVSDQTAILKFTLGSDGRFTPPSIVATGIPGDDFAVGRDGSLFVTTHPYDTIVRVSPDGSKTTIANRGQHIVGATDAVFGMAAGDADTLYVVTDGDAFTGGPRTRGELIALKPFGR